MYIQAPACVTCKSRPREPKRTIGEYFDRCSYCCIEKLSVYGLKPGRVPVTPAPTAAMTHPGHMAFGAPVVYAAPTAPPPPTAPRTPPPPTAPKAPGDQKKKEDDLKIVVHINDALPLLGFNRSNQEVYYKDCTLRRDMQNQGCMSMFYTLDKKSEICPRCIDKMKSLS